MDSALTSVLINLGAGFIVVAMIILGLLIPKPTYQRLLEENEKLKEALALERQRSNDATQAGSVTNQLIGALTTLASEHKTSEAREHPEIRGLPMPAENTTALDLTAKDLGL